MPSGQRNIGKRTEDCGRCVHERRDGTESKDEMRPDEGGKGWLGSESSSGSVWRTSALRVTAAVARVLFRAKCFTSGSGRLRARIGFGRENRNTYIMPIVKERFMAFIWTYLDAELSTSFNNGRPAARNNYTTVFRRSLGHHGNSHFMSYLFNQSLGHLMRHLRQP